MYARMSELMAAAHRHLSWWGLRPEYKTVIVADSGTYPPLLDACSQAATALGADPIVITFPTRPQPFTELPELAQAAMVKADFLLTLTSESWSYTETLFRLFREAPQQIRARWDGREEDVPHFLELLPDPDVRARSRRARELIDAARMLRITSRLGTDLTFARGDPTKRIAYVPDGQCAFAPPTESANGVLMFRGAYRTRCPGPLGHKGLVRLPVRLTIEAGVIQSISTDTEAGVFLAEWFASWDDPDVYKLAHMNLGLDHRIHLEYLDNLAVHFNYGGILTGWGLNQTPRFGAEEKRQASAHMELQLTGASLFLDDTQILAAGEFTPESGLSARQDRTHQGVPVSNRRHDR